MTCLPIDAAGSLRSKHLDFLTQPTEGAVRVNPGGAVLFCRGFHGGSYLRSSPTT